MFVQCFRHVHQITHAVMEEFARLLRESVSATAPIQITMDQCAKQVQITDICFLWEKDEDTSQEWKLNFSFLFQHAAGDPWEAPDGWDTLHPQLNLNLDDQTPYVLHNGAMHVATDVSGFFKRLVWPLFERSHFNSTIKMKAAYIDQIKRHVRSLFKFYPRTVTVSRQMGEHSTWISGAVQEKLVLWMSIHANKVMFNKSGSSVFTISPFLKKCWRTKSFLSGHWYCPTFQSLTWIPPIHLWSDGVFTLAWFGTGTRTGTRTMKNGLYGFNKSLLRCTWTGTGKNTKDIFRTWSSSLSLFRCSVKGSN